MREGEKEARKERKRRKGRKGEGATGVGRLESTINQLKEERLKFLRSIKGPSKEHWLGGMFCMKSYMESLYLSPKLS